MAPTIKRFRGLNNVTDPLRLSPGWLQKADNIDISDTGAISRRAGYSLVVAGTPSSAYATCDFERCYIVDGSTLKQMFDGGDTVDIAALTVGAPPMKWAEINKHVFYSNGIDSGIITQDNSIVPWAWPVANAPRVGAAAGSMVAGLYRVACTFLLPDGRETGSSDYAEITLAENQSLLITDIPQVAGLRTQLYITAANSTVFSLAIDGAAAAETWNFGPDALGMEMVGDGCDPLPDGCSYIAMWQGRAVASQYIPASDSTVIWMSKPLAFHLFDLAKDFILVPGEVTMLIGHEDGLIIGTHTKVMAYDGDNMKELADYGVVPGYGAAHDYDSGKIMFWSKRGLCTALPFSNVTQRQISVDCGLSAGAAIVSKNGAKRYVVALQKGGTNFNPRSTS